MDLMKIEDRMHEKDAAFYPVDLPDGSVGKWELSKVTLEKDARISIQNMRHIRDGMPEMVVSPGTYQRLVGPCGAAGGRAVMMSNTQLEYRTNKHFVDTSHGDVLIVGLGIGMLIRPIAARPEVKSITVLELEPDVIELVKPHYADVEKLRVFCADARDFEPGDLMGNLPDTWDCIMIDIWPDISPENLRQMTKLKHRFALWQNAGGGVHCWSEGLAKRMQRIERQMARLYA
jgi:hypothetical protein